MTLVDCIKTLSRHKVIIESLLDSTDNDFIQFKKDGNAWSPLTIICHLVDEEIHDFRARVQHCLAHPETKPLAIDPEEWGISRAYEKQVFEQKLKQWSRERTKSIDYLKTLDDKELKKGFDHDHYGRFDVQFILDNWIAHDLLHIRQITRSRYQYLQKISTSAIEYAGTW